MKNKLSLLLLAALPAFIHAQGLYPINKLEQKFDEQSAESFKIRNDSPAESTSNFCLSGRSVAPSGKIKDTSLAREVNRLVIDIHTRNLKELADKCNEFESTRKTLERQARFNDSAFRAQVRMLFNSDKLFDETYKAVNNKDSVLLAEFSMELANLNYYKTDMEYDLKKLVAETAKGDPFALFNYRNQMDDICTGSSSVIEKLSNLKQDIAQNRALLYQETDRVSKNERSVNEANAVPSILSGFNDINIVPTLNIVAQRYIRREKSGEVYGANLFLSGEATLKDSSSEKDYKRTATYSMLQPEASKFGFRFNYQRSYFVSDARNNKNRVEFQVNLNYLLKSLPAIKTDSAGLRTESGAASAGFFHGKAGFELFFAEYFSIYSSLNYLHCIQNASVYTDYFLLKQSETNLFFLNFGLNANLAFTNEQNNIRVGLDFIVNNTRIRKLDNSSDLLIPSLRFTYVPNLGKSF